MQYKLCVTFVKIKLININICKKVYLIEYGINRKAINRITKKT